MRGHRQKYRRPLSSRSSEASSNIYNEDISESFSSGSDNDEKDSEYSLENNDTCSPNLPSPPPAKIQHQRLLQSKSRSPTNARASKGATSSNSRNIPRQSSYIESQYSSSDGSGISFRSDRASSDESSGSTLTNIESTRKSWRDYFSSCSKQIHIMFDRLWNSDYAFVYMTLSICVVSGLVILVLAIRKREPIHDSDYGMNETVLDTLIPSTSPLSKMSLSPHVIQSTKPSLTPTKIMSFNPSISPTETMSYEPSTNPTLDTSPIPSQRPSLVPTISPSISTKPSHEPSIYPTLVPTVVPSISFEPSLSSNPSSAPSEKQCTCAPLTYHFKIDLKKGCPLNISDSRGIKGTIDCKYESTRNHTNFSPIVVTEVSITELNSDLTDIQTYRKNATMLDGFIITFESVTTSGQITGGLKGSFKAINVDGEFTLNFSFLFSNTCEILPFNVDDSIGFLVFTKISKPIPRTCYYVVTESPSLSPTSSPTKDFSPQPSEKPSSIPSINPSGSPSNQPSNQPSQEPSTEPSQYPTLAPSSKPSPEPTDKPSSLPTEVHSTLPSSSPSKSLQWDKLGSTIYGQTANLELGKAVAISNDGKTLAVSQHNEYSIDVYDNKEGVWVKRNTPVIGPKNSGFGSMISVSKDGKIVAGGGYMWDNSRGLVQVWEWNGWFWVRLGSTMLGSRQKDHFGYSLALSNDGNILIVGSRDHDSNEARGSARVMRYDGEDWVQRGSRLTGDYAGDYFASKVDSVSISNDGNIIAIGAYGGNVVRAFKWDDTNWVQYGTDIYHSDKVYFGAAVELSSGTNENLVLAIGSPREEPGGLIHFYEWKGNNWSQRPDSVSIKSSIFIGYSIALSNDGNTVLCATDEAVFVFDWGSDNKKWIQRGDPILEVGGDPYGRTAKTEILVDLSGDGNTVVVGLPQDDDGDLHGENKGQVRSFTWQRPE